ncbi:Swt1 family HEPN domain-containing protein [Micromonospora chalcea]
MGLEEQNVTPRGADPLETTLDAVPELPRRVLATYARLMQLETWLRQMVYVELRAAYGNAWQQSIARLPGISLNSDARLTHMPTPEQSPISYITFGTLLKTIANNWHLFEPYLPPQDLWTSKLEEVSQIRNRVAHFRYGHGDDLDRVLRFMRDIDQGFWRFCTSYNNTQPVLPPTRDPVVKRFHALNKFPYVQVEKRKWAMVGAADPDAILSVAVNVLRRPWRADRATGRIAGQDGYLYDVSIAGQHRRSFDYSRYLQDTARLHGSLVHICLDAFGAAVRVTIPAALGTRLLNTTIQGFVDWAPNALHRSTDTVDRQDEIERVAEEWPEYVLGPKNPLCYLGPDMPCSFFAA